MSLTGCATSGALSIKGACNSFVAPITAVAGKTPPDQEWVDETTESGISACGWPRPKARPVALKKKVPMPVARPVAAPVPVPELHEVPATDDPVPVRPVTKWDQFKLWLEYWAVH